MELDMMKTEEEARKTLKYWQEHETTPEELGILMNSYKNTTSEHWTSYKEGYIDAYKEILGEPIE